MKYLVMITPIHGVEVEADRHEMVCGTHRFWRGGSVGPEVLIAEFSQSIGWMELMPETRAKASVSPLTLVTSNQPQETPPAA